MGNCTGGFWQLVRCGIDITANWVGEWVLIPALFIIIIYLADSIVRSAVTGSHHEISVRAGRWAGFIGLAVYITSTDPGVIAQILPVAGGISWPYLAFFPLGAIWGSLLVFILKKFIPSRLGGLVVAALVFLGSASFFTYVVYHDTGFSDILRWWTLGQTFGILILASISPRSIQEFLPGKLSNPFDKSDDKSVPVAGEAETGLDAAAEPDAQAPRTLDESDTELNAELLDAAEAASTGPAVTETSPLVSREPEPET